MGPRVLTPLSAPRTAPLLSSPLRSCQRARSSTQTEPETHLLVDSLPSMSLARIWAQQRGAVSGRQHISSRGRAALSRMSWTSRPESRHPPPTILSDDHCDFYFYNSTHPQE